MGSEAVCTARFKGKTASGKARLETEVLHFRGGDLTLSIDDEAFLNELENAVAFISIGRTVKGSDATFYGVSREAELPRIEKAEGRAEAERCAVDDSPKGRPEISEGSVMAAGKAASLVDVKVVSVSTTRTAEKFVIPLKNRA